MNYFIPLSSFRIFPNDSRKLENFNRKHLIDYLIADIWNLSFFLKDLICIV